MRLTKLDARGGIRLTMECTFTTSSSPMSNGNTDELPHSDPADTALRAKDGAE